jgi:hypothetical protein
MQKYFIATMSGLEKITIFGWLWPPDLRVEHIVSKTGNILM